MTPRFKQQLLRWWLGMNIATLQGGAVALKSFLTLAGASAAGVPVPALNLQQAAYVFLGGAAYHLIDYLTSNPLPIPVRSAECGVWSPESASGEAIRANDGTLSAAGAPLPKIPSTEKQPSNPTS